jgi:hypothetical protein
MAIPVAAVPRNYASFIRNSTPVASGRSIKPAP